LKRFLAAGVLLMALAATGACRHRNPDQLPPRPISDEGAGFHGMISSITEQLIVAVEDRAATPRRGEISLWPNTEIVTRVGQDIPRESLHRGMRITVWFTNDFTESATLIQGRADRIVVDK